MLSVPWDQNFLLGTRKNYQRFKGKKPVLNEPCSNTSKSSSGLQMARNHCFGEVIVHKLKEMLSVCFCRYGRTEGETTNVFAQVYLPVFSFHMKHKEAVACSSFYKMTCCFSLSLHLGLQKLTAGQVMMKKALHGSQRKHGFWNLCRELSNHHMAEGICCSHLAKTVNLTREEIGNSLAIQRTGS